MILDERHYILSSAHNFSSVASVLQEKSGMVGISSVDNSEFAHIILC